MKPVVRHASPTSLNQNLIESYLKTNYEVHVEPQYVLRIGNQSAEFADYLRNSTYSSAAYITAYNPYGESLMDHENEKRSKSLYDDIVSFGYSPILGIGRDPKGLWPGEKSYLIPGITFDEAMMLGNKYEQNAILWIGDSAYVQLLLLV